MSFSENPYASMELITEPPPEVWDLVPERIREYWQERGRGAVDVHCGGCGAQDVAKGAVTISSPIALARLYFSRHIRDSHGRTPKDMRDWNWMV